MAPDDVEQNQQDSGCERCFRCGQMYPRAYMRVLHDDCSEVFKDRSLCVGCAAIVKGKYGDGWWFGDPSVAGPASSRSE